MVDIIVLIFLCWKNSKKAIRKGLSPRKWIWYTIAGWLITEFVGLLLGVMLLGKTSLLLYNNQDYSALFAMCLISAFGGYLYVRAKLEKMPDSINDDDINKIGVSDLQPPPRKD